MAKSMKLGGGGRFAKVEAEARAGGARNPAAVAAAAGRKKYGAAKMAEMSAAGRRRAKDNPIVFSSVHEMDADPFNKRGANRIPSGQAVGEHGPMEKGGKAVRDPMEGLRPQGGGSRDRTYTSGRAQGPRGSGIRKSMQSSGRVPKPHLARRSDFHGA